MPKAPDLTISQQLAHWAGQLTWDDVPFDVLHQTKLRVLDITGAMLGGLDTELVAQLARATFVDDNGVGTPVLGYAQTTGAPAAALLQATMGCVLEFDDSHVATGLHASTPMVAAAMVPDFMAWKIPSPVAALVNRAASPIQSAPGAATRPIRRV